MWEYINADRYPLHDLDSVAGQVLVDKSRQTLEKDGVLELADFLRPETVIELVLEAGRLASSGHRMEGEFSPYSDDMSETGNYDLTDNHPRNIKLPAAHRFVAGDLLPRQSPLRKIYASHTFLRFVCAVLNRGSLHRLADDMGALNYVIYEPGDDNGWHFDTTDFVLSIPLQSAEIGGKYQYIRDLRSAHDENLDQVRWRMEHPDDCKGVGTVQLRPGTLFFFKGRYTLHRVSRVLGNRNRMVAIISFHQSPGHRLSHSSKLAMYGRTAPG